MLLGLAFLVLLGVVFGHGGGHVGGKEPENTLFSMPNLISIFDDQEKLTRYWQGSGELNEGRYILTTKESLFGEVWGNNLFNEKEFTFEVTLRSLGYHGKNVGSGLYIYLVEDAGMLDQFKGLKIAFVNDGQPSVRVYLGDGTRSTAMNDFIGSYHVEYQDSNVPVTLKFGYGDGMMKMTIDNKLMFETNKINFPVNNMRIGVVGDSRGEHAEQYELLRFKAYDGLTESLKMKCSESLFANYQAPVQGQQGQQPVSNGFNDREKRLREDLASNVGVGQLRKEIGDEFDRIKGMLGDTKVAQAVEQLRTDVNAMQYQLETLTSLFKRQFEMMDAYDVRMGSIDRVLQTQLDKADSIDKQFTNFVARSGASVAKPLPVEKTGHPVVWGLVLIVVVLVVLTMLIFKLRSDIRHFKVL